MTRTRSKARRRAAHGHRDPNAQAGITIDDSDADHPHSGPVSRLVAQRGQQMVCQQSVILVIPPWHKTLLNNRAAWSAARGDTRGQARAIDQDVDDRGAADTSVRCAMRGRACEACAGSGVRALRDDTPPSLFSSTFQLSCYPVEFIQRTLVGKNEGQHLWN